MTEAEQAFEAAKRRIAKAQAEGAEELSFDKEAFRALEEIPAEIGALDKLRTLDLDKTRVSDLTPLAALTGLQRLWLNHTGVTDLAPLAALTGLQLLRLDQTGVTDLAPLAGAGQAGHGP